MHRSHRWRLKAFLLTTVIGLVIWKLLGHFLVGVYQDPKYTIAKALGNRYLADGDSNLPGYILARRIRDHCKNVTQFSSSDDVRVSASYNDEYTQTCIISGAGSTFIKRLYMMKSPRFQHLKLPYDIGYDTPFATEDRISNDTRIKVMFVRDPYHRLVSSYIEMLVAPNYIYWQTIGTEVIRMFRKNPSERSKSCGHDVKFEEFIKYVIHKIQSRRKNKMVIVDPHIDVMSVMCRPCQLQYDYVGKIETFPRDSKELLRLLDIPKGTRKVLAAKGPVLAEDDAIENTLNQALLDYNKEMYKNCMTVHDALKRAWLSLQMRGLIGWEALTVPREESLFITLREMVDQALNARAKVTGLERQELRFEHFMELYTTISMKDMNSLRTIYKADFTIFDYDDKPQDLFYR